MCRYAQTKKNVRARLSRIYLGLFYFQKKRQYELESETFSLKCVNKCECLFIVKKQEIQDHIFFNVC